MPTPVEGDGAGGQRARPAQGRDAEDDQAGAERDQQQRDRLERQAEDAGERPDRLEVVVHRDELRVDRAHERDGGGDLGLSVGDGRVLRAQVGLELGRRHVWCRSAR